jgi:hypothetical protein
VAGSRFCIRRFCRQVVPKCQSVRQLKQFWALQDGFLHSHFGLLSFGGRQLDVKAVGNLASD